MSGAHGNRPVESTDEKGPATAWPSAAVRAPPRPSPVPAARAPPEIKPHWAFHTSPTILDACKQAPLGIVTTVSTGSVVLKSPHGLCLDTAGNMYVTDFDSFVIRKFTLAGVESIVAGRVDVCGNADGVGSEALFNTPYGIAIDNNNANLYVTDCGEHKIRKIALNSGRVTTFAGSGTKGLKNGPAMSAEFSTPYGICLDKEDNVYVADSENELIRMITPGGEVMSFAGSDRGHTNGSAATAKFFAPVGVCLDKEGNLFVADCGNHLIRRVDHRSRQVTTFAGCGREGWEDGLVAEATFQYPGSICIDSVGVMYVTDSAGHMVRRIAPVAPYSTLRRTLNLPKELLRLIFSYCEIIVTTVAGNNNPGRTDGSGLNAQFDWPYAVVHEHTEETEIADTTTTTLLVADKTNSRLRRVAIEH